MKLHANAALSLRQRRRMVLLVVERGCTISAAAAAFQTSPRTCGKWVSRFRASSECGLLDRSSAPHRVANRTDERTVEVIAALRRFRLTGAAVPASAFWAAPRTTAAPPPPPPDGAAARPVGLACTSPSTTPPAWPTPKC